MPSHAIPFGSPAALIAHNAQLVTAPTTQSIAIVVCGGGNPFAEYDRIAADVKRLGLPSTVFVGNDMIGHFPFHAEHGGTLHPDKLHTWTARRADNGFEPIPHIWAHRPFNGVTNWTRDWSGSTGLFMTKVARENGHTHIALCGVPMTVEAGHFVRNERWDAAHGFRRGWTSHENELKGYVRSYGGWTQELFGGPTDEWLTETIEDKHKIHAPRTGQKA